MKSLLISKMLCRRRHSVVISKTVCGRQHNADIYNDVLVSVASPDETSYFGFVRDSSLPIHLRFTWQSTFQSTGRAYSRYRRCERLET